MSDIKLPLYTTIGQTAENEIAPYVVDAAGLAVPIDDLNAHIAALEDEIATYGRSVAGELRRKLRQRAEEAERQRDQYREQLASVTVQCGEACGERDRALKNWSLHSDKRGKAERQRDEAVGMVRKLADRVDAAVEFIEDALEEGIEQGETRMRVEASTAVVWLSSMPSAQDDVKAARALLAKLTGGGDA